MNYKANNSHFYRQYELTKIQTIDLMTGYNIELRIKINRRWEELENQVSKNSPNLSRMDILQLALEAAWIKVIGRKFALSEYPDMLTLNKTCVAIKAQLVESY